VKNLRFGIFNNGYYLAPWQARALSLITDALPVVIIIEGNLPKLSAGVDIRLLLPTIPAVYCVSEKKLSGMLLCSEASVDEIIQYKPDFILKFHTGGIEGDLLSKVPFGIWEFRFGTQCIIKRWHYGFYEVFHNLNVTPARLVKLSSSIGEVVVLEEGFFKTRASVKANRALLQTEASVWPAKVCRRILKGLPLADEEKRLTICTGLHVDPGFYYRITCFFKAYFRSIFKKMRLLCYTDFWNIGVVNAPIADFLKGNPEPVNWLPLTDKRKFFADPFVLRDGPENPKYHIFCETYPFAKGKGIIEHLIWDNGFSGPVSTVLEEPAHLSYPYVFKEDGKHYMIPEHYQSGKVGLYESVDFPGGWQKKCTLLDDFSGIDSTLVKWDGLYWMFSSDRTEGYTNKLKLFYAEKLEGPWLPHTLNPVKTDIRSARCAGTPFEHEGKLFRPAMDYSEKLQGKIVINRIDRLTKEEFVEVSVKEIFPYSNSPYPDKIHTLTAMDNFTLIDGCREVCILTNFGLLKYNMKLLMRKFNR